MSKGDAVEDSLTRQVSVPLAPSIAISASFSRLNV